MSFTRSAAFDRGFSRFQFTHHASPYDAAGRCAALDRLDMLATMFDTAFILPGTNVRFGVESLLRLLFARMASNVALEALVGAVPLAGDAFDVFFRANRRNVALLRKHFARTGYR